MEQEFGDTTGYDVFVPDTMAMPRTRSLDENSEVTPPAALSTVIVFHSIHCQNFSNIGKKEKVVSKDTFYL